MNRTTCKGAQRSGAPRRWLYALCAASMLLSVAACGGGSAGPGTNGTGVSIGLTAIPSPVAPTDSFTPSPSPSPSPVDPGTLPQTHVLPHPDDPVFQAGVQDLWQAIVQDDPSIALPFFFPKGAYLQVKAISNPLADYQSRLIAWYGLDIHAAHALLGSHSSSARFVKVTVPTSQAEWIRPGVEYNKGSYYRLYGTRLTYRINGVTKSFGIFSLISWRGEWYCVHLGPAVRSSNRGIVYSPQG
ncbi:hypothetical protein KGA66_02920 [Actinocrinis puniceicyclus]|uniref:Lipoprotein n=1 Tax=Actinocrinis puniceicyclus TaxID=977794 RepID=A0A8J7WM54_9ACTN|nr:hypothetical protein [Actinocrinis puniceicyclus]MBS2961984.1 hypothetical protein [Actinocrinis puniceicyclus]